MILQRIEWNEFHKNGQIWIRGEIGIVADLWKHLYDIRIGFKGFEGKPVCRLGNWTKYYDNGQMAWTLSYDEYGYTVKDSYPQFRKDGTGINY